MPRASGNDEINEEYGTGANRRVRGHRRARGGAANRGGGRSGGRGHTDDINEPEGESARNPNIVDPMTPAELQDDLLR
jgi:hypothetical protein